MRDAAFDDLLARARAVPIEHEIERRGIRLKSGGRFGRAGPCPICGGRDRFWIDISKQCFGCRGCKVGGDVIRLVEHIDSVDFKTAIELLTRDGPRLAPTRTTAPPQDAQEYDRDQHRKAAWLWSQRRPIVGTIAERYLRLARGITCALPPTLAFLRASEQYPPAMIAAFAIPREIEPGILGEPRRVESVHLTELKLDGTGKADAEKPKKIIGSPGALPIVLAPPNDLLALTITEGIEDALSARQATGLGAWAAGNAGRMPTIAKVIPAYTETITIFAHPDTTGQRGARELAERLACRGVEVFVEGLLP